MKITFYQSFNRTKKYKMPFSKIREFIISKIKLKIKLNAT